VRNHRQIGNAASGLSKGRAVNLLFFHDFLLGFSMPFDQAEQGRWNGKQERKPILLAIGDGDSLANSFFMYNMIAPRIEFFFILCDVALIPKVSSNEIKSDLTITHFISMI